MHMNKVTDYVGYGAFGVALMATLGSLAASEVFHIPPCSLCWYQRIFMYPLVIIIGMGIVRRDKSWPLYTMAIAGVGGLIALYHSLLQWGVISSSLAPCVGGVSCAEQEFNFLGFITMPFLSFIAFISIIAMTAVFWKGSKNDQRD